MANQKSDNQNTTKRRLDQLTAQEEKILRIVREERKLIQNKFPLPVALLGTFGFICTWAGLYRIIQEIDIIYRNPVMLLAFGLAVLIITGAAYKKL